jgi:hypothetical protein
MTEPKSPKPMPSAAVINAYLEESAARTRMRLPLAKGNAAVVPLAKATPDASAPAPASASGKSKTRELPLQGSKKREPRAPVASAPTAAGGPSASDGAWRPFSTDDESE